MDGEELHKLPLITTKGPGFGLGWMTVLVGVNDLLWPGLVTVSAATADWLDRRFPAPRREIFGFKPMLRCSIVFSISEISNEVPVYSTDRYILIRSLAVNSFGAALTNVQVVNRHFDSCSSTRRQFCIPTPYVQCSKPLWISPQQYVRWVSWLLVMILGLNSTLIALSNYKCRSHDFCLVSDRKRSVLTCILHWH